MLTVESRGAVRASADRVYRLIADYKNGHPRILPFRYFRNMQVERGGIGAGTIVTFDMIVLGAVQKARAVITEPQPGRVLVESYPATGIITTFVVEPNGPSNSFATIRSDYPTKSGLAGVIERAFVRWYLTRVFRAELEQIDEVATEPIASRKSA